MPDIQKQQPAVGQPETSRPTEGEKGSIAPRPEQPLSNPEGRSRQESADAAIPFFSEISEYAAGDGARSAAGLTGRLCNRLPYPRDCCLCLFLPLYFPDRQEA